MYLFNLLKKWHAPSLALMAELSERGEEDTLDDEKSGTSIGFGELSMEHSDQSQREGSC